MIEVELPDGSIAEFPDGTPREQMQAALQSRFGAAPAKPAESPFMAGGFKGALGGVLRGLRDPIDAGAQMLVRGANAIGLAPDTEVQRVDAINRGAEQDYRKNWRGGQDIGFDAARLFGNVASTAPLAVAGPAAGASMAARALQAGAAGAGFGTLQPVEDTGNFWAEKGKQAGLGTVAGAAAAPLTAGLARIISPQSSPQVQTLLREGVTPTPGQVLGGTARSLEESATSIPLLGSAIKMGQQRATEQLDRAAINRALKPIGTFLPVGKTGREAIEFAEEALSKEYDRVLNRIGTVPVDNTLLGELTSLRQMLQMTSQPKQLAERLDKVLDSELLQRTQYGRLTGEAVKAAESNLGNLAAQFKRTTDYDTQMLGAAVSEARRSLRQWLERNAPADAAQDLRKVNEGWANFKRVQRAAGMVGSDEGVFTAAQLQNSVKALDRSKDKGAFARGDALLQDLSDAAKSVLTSRTPNSGTADRALASAAILGPLAGAQFLTPGLAAAALPAAMYLPGVQRGVASMLAGRQQAPFRALSQGLLNLTPMAGAALSPAGYGLLE